MSFNLIKGLAFVSLLSLAAGTGFADEAATATQEPTQKTATAEHKTHENHKHKHGSKNCKHKSEKHADHTDYEHDGHHHTNHDGHADECDNQHS